MDRPRQTNRGMNMNKITIEKFCEIFEEDARALLSAGWMIEDEYLYV